MKNTLSIQFSRTRGVRLLLGALAAGSSMLSLACSDDDGVPPLVFDGGLPGTSNPEPNAPDAAVDPTSDTSESSSRSSDTSSEARTTDGTSAPTDETSTSGTQTSELPVDPTSGASTSTEPASEITTDLPTADLPTTELPTTELPTTDVSSAGISDPTSDSSTTDSSSPEGSASATTDVPTSEPTTEDGSTSGASSESTTELSTSEPEETTTDSTGTVIVIPEPSSTVDGNTSAGPGNGGTITLDLDGDAGADAGDSDAGDSDAGDSDAGADAGLDDSSEAWDAGVDASVDEGPELHVATLIELTDKSEPDYADNEHGLIEGSRLATWLSDWPAQRPAGIDGRLVILQVVPSVAGTQVNIPENPAQGVVSYIVGANEFNAPRNNGLSAFETDLPSGQDADAWFKKYAIDPRSDFVLIAFEELGNTSNTIVHSVGRAWLFLKYWGVAKEHLGILNGSINWNSSNHGITLANNADATFTVPPDNGTFSVKDSGVDATLSVISLEEIIAILHEEEGADPVSKVRIVDARGGAEALGLLKATSTGRTDCTSYTGTAPNARCSTPFEGRIKGARSVPWAQFLDTKANGFRFLPYNDVKAVFDSQAEWSDSLEWTIQYCRTNQRSTVTGIVASVILGYPTRLYETSFIEWGHASTVPPVVDESFPFRTDLPTLTEHAVLHPDDVGNYTPGGTLGELTQPVTWVAGPNYNAPEDVSPVSAEPWPANASGWPKLDANATTTRLAIDEDRAYLRGVSVEDL
jgi:thiosulfate/3-mercaptopyruvate sulfurtransferase